MENEVVRHFVVVWCFISFLLVPELKRNNCCSVWIILTHLVWMSLSQEYVEYWWSTIHVGKTMIALYSSFIPHRNSIVAPLIHMSSSCPGNDTMSEAKSAPVHPITEPFCYASRTTHAAQAGASYRADGALKPHCLGRKPQSLCTVEAWKTWNAEASLYVWHAYTFPKTTLWPASEKPKRSVLLLAVRRQLRALAHTGVKDWGHREDEEPTSYWEHPEWKGLF